MRQILLVCFVFWSLLVNGQSYHLYGETTIGGINNDGVLFNFNPVTCKDSVLFSFNGTDGNTASRSLVLESDSILLGSSEYGGVKNQGVLFRYNLLTGKEDSVTSFMGLNGANPFGGLVKASNGLFYGGTGRGGVYNAGEIFSYNSLLNQYNVLYSFNDTDGFVLYGSLLQIGDSLLYGITTEGGAFNVGIIFNYNILTNKENVLLDFNNTNGKYSQSSLILGQDGLLYGMTEEGGTKNDGTLFSFDTKTLTEKVLVDFDSLNGSFPFGDLMQTSDGLMYGLTSSGGFNNDGVLFSFNPVTSKDTVLLQIGTLNGAWYPSGNLIEDTLNQILYGMAQRGGVFNHGVIFSYNLKTGKDSLLFNFNGANGSTPDGSLLLIYDKPTGIQELVKSKQITVFPNPSKGLFTFQLHGVNESTKIQIYNILGEIVYEQEFIDEKAAVDLRSLSKDLYLYRASNKSGDLNAYGKIIIQ